MKPSSLMLAAACIAMLVTTGHAQPNPFSANQVMKGCRAVVAKTKSGNETLWFLRGICMGAVSTLAAAATAFERAAEGTIGVCIPAGTSVNQQVRVVVTYIDARPNRSQEDFRVLALEALKDAWPCKG
jgi:Ssp1 endopeptidase immunity protein Rap1a